MLSHHSRSGVHKINNPDSASPIKVNHLFCLVNLLLEIHDHSHGLSGLSRIMSQVMHLFLEILYHLQFLSILSRIMSHVNIGFADECSHSQFKFARMLKISPGMIHRGTNLSQSKAISYPDTCLVGVGR